MGIGKEELGLGVWGLGFWLRCDGKICSGLGMRKL